MTLEELYEKNEHLATITANKMFPRIKSFARSIRLEVDDIYQFARMGLWTACKSYKGDKTKYSFKSHAIRNIKWYVNRSLYNETNEFQYYKTKRLEKRLANNKVALLSLSNTIDDGGKKTYEDIMSCDYINQFESENPEAKVMYSLYEARIFKAVRPQDLPYLKLRLKDLTYLEIAKHFGVSKQNVKNRMDKIQETLNNKGIGVEY